MKWTSLYRLSLCLLPLTAACDCEISHVDVDWAGTDPAPIPGQWRQYRLTPEHQGVAPEGTTVGPDLELVWKSAPLAIGSYGASKSSPTVDDTQVYVGVDDGRLVALDRETGLENWSFRTRRYENEATSVLPNHLGIHGTAAVDETTVYIGDYSGWLYAIDKFNGDLLWERSLGGSIGASPTLHRGHVFIAVEYPVPEGKIWALNAATGDVVFESCYLGNHPHSSTTIDPTTGMVYVGANNGRFFAFDFVNGTEVWRRRFSLGVADIKSTAAIEGDTVYISSWDKKLHALDAKTGKKRWNFKTTDRSMSSPSVHNGVAYFGSHDDALYAVDTQTGKERWSYLTGGSIMASPTVVPETEVVIIGSRDHVVSMLDVHDGSLLWSYELDGEFSGVPTATGESLYLFDATGTTWRFDVNE